MIDGVEREMDVPVAGRAAAERLPMEFDYDRVVREPDRHQRESAG